MVLGRAPLPPPPLAGPTGAEAVAGHTVPQWPFGGDSYPQTAVDSYVDPLAVSTVAFLPLSNEDPPSTTPPPDEFVAHLPKPRRTSRCPLFCVFYAEFDNVVGPRVCFQSPEVIEKYSMALWHPL